MARRALKIALGVGIAAGGLAASKWTDPDVLARVGALAAAKASAAAPESSVFSGPLAAFKPGSVLPVEERVRIRIESDKDMDGARVAVLPGAAAGEVKLRGVVAAHAQRQRAAALAEGTVGVDRVANEIAVPEQ